MLHLIYRKCCILFTVHTARARGRLGGRPKALDSEKQQHAIDLYHEKKFTIKVICEIAGISKPTLYKYLRAEEDNKGILKYSPLLGQDLINVKNLNGVPPFFGQA